MTTNEEREQKENITEKIVRHILSKESLTRLLNIKAVDLERYYKIEGLLCDIYRTQHVQEISNEDFLKIIKQTEKQKTTFVYRSRTSIMDDLD
ncbi:hypothetical protein NEAUS04_0160 [Nematocida ausubeli]|uniref:Uncharacterized protein n=1 Tax=Nematocida ausubeli (strain ATCC PRA-371 / ERTm2) TaxID=1913371 RepID=H8ZAB1_NEMA1|nr:uncharacterized protein NESG_02457 [Nematocida ausubeli]EHY66892.1 hypothetical protein NERG_00532 [Nematocida ausubeli]KAI5132213.1 hypothetical protein NEAUS06_0002 [Nematocida ausubeli]KAI5139072.1 hypothetical protein NEAUS07_2592 [Nematocida ausubeli]KAI5151795.1 hypothetical protein NEAUS05_2595 [Nematocida ausubeli]KAI5160827.1 hypothetical protein NEAUS04_0160 [Nematocida ausubeli]